MSTVGMEVEVAADFAEWLLRFASDCGREPSQVERMSAYGELARRAERRRA